MRHIGIKTIGINQAIAALLSFLVVISSASVWVQEDLNLIPSKPVKLAIWMLAILLIVINSTRFKTTTILYLFFIIVCFFGYMFFNFDYTYPSIVSVFIPAALFALLGGLNRKENHFFILEAFVNILFVMASVSLVFFFLASVFKVLQPTGYYSFKWSWIDQVPSFFNLYYEPVPARINSIPIAKNCGIFPEAPMYNFPLCVALGIDKLVLKNRRSFRSAVLLLTVITVQSTTGYLFLAVLYGYLFLKNCSKKSSYFKPITGMAIIIAAAIVLYYLVEGKKGSFSYAVRFDHLKGFLQAILHSNFMGLGVDNESAITDFFSFQQGASLGLLYLLAEGGLFCFLVLFVPVALTIRKARKKHDHDAIMFACLFFMLVFLTQVVFRSNMWFVVGCYFMNIEEYLYSPNSKDKQLV